MDTLTSLRRAVRFAIGTPLLVGSTLVAGLPALAQAPAASAADGLEEVVIFPSADP